ncbi:hypothetical protein [Polaromonas sp.]|uniref:hypothetical protein n=1 Tax=Polaromonas sp. TaxID=1869339 RepID=UPI002FCAAB9C
MTTTARTYTVKLVDAQGLSTAQRSAAELRFRMALDFALGGPEYVLPALQTCLLVRALNEDQPPESTPEAEQQVIALWEKAEADAIMAAFKPLGKEMGDARFVIRS